MSDARPVPPHGRNLPLLIWSAALPDAAPRVVRVGFGPQPRVGAAPEAHTGTDRAGPAPTEYAPSRHAPTGDPDGALGSASGADRGTPRHGDVRAVAPQPRITFRPLSEAPERVDAPAVREPYRDIPVSPA